jgi:hypothetical protein
MGIRAIPIGVCRHRKTGILRNRGVQASSAGQIPAGLFRRPASSKRCTRLWLCAGNIRMGLTHLAGGRRPTGSLSRGQRYPRPGRVSNVRPLVSRVHGRGSQRLCLIRRAHGPSPRRRVWGHTSRATGGTWALNLGPYARIRTLLD